jgi:thiol:disulfide interchange protein DsbA
MRSLRFALIAASLAAANAFASPATPVNGKEFITLATPQPVQKVGNKVEVVEWFAYHCPACFSLEAPLHAWVKGQGDKINFKRMPLPFGGPTDPEARMFLTLESMGILEQYHGKIFNAYHIQRAKLRKDEDFIDWAAKNGIDKTKFLSHWNSFGVTTKLRRLVTLAESAKVTGTPTLIIDGKYQTSPSMVMEANPHLQGKVGYDVANQTLDALVAKAAGGK